MLFKFHLLDKYFAKAIEKAKKNARNTQSNNTASKPIYIPPIFPVSNAMDIQYIPKNSCPKLYAKLNLRELYKLQKLKEVK